MKNTRINNHNGTQIEQVFLANTPWLRLRGLLGRKRLTNEQGLLISPCNSVHTIGMKYSLDIVYLNNKNKVLKITKNLKPWRSSACRGATKVLELNAGNTENKNIKQGDTLLWQDS
jgi:hypothetical protein